MVGPDPGIGGTLLVRWENVVGVFGDVGDASVKPMADFCVASATGIGWISRVLLGNDEVGPSGIAAKSPPVLL